MHLFVCLFVCCILYSDNTETVLLLNVAISRERRRQLTSMLDYNFIYQTIFNQRHIRRVERFKVENRSPAKVRIQKYGKICYDFCPLYSNTLWAERLLTECRVFSFHGTRLAPAPASRSILTFVDAWKILLDTYLIKLYSFCYNLLWLFVTTAEVSQRFPIHSKVETQPVPLKAFEHLSLYTGWRVGIFYFG